MDQWTIASHIWASVIKWRTLSNVELQVPRPSGIPHVWYYPHNNSDVIRVYHKAGCGRLIQHMCTKTRYVTVDDGLYFILHKTAYDRIQIMPKWYDFNLSGGLANGKFKNISMEEDMYRLSGFLSNVIISSLTNNKIELYIGAPFTVYTRLGHE